MGEKWAMGHFSSKKLSKHLDVSEIVRNFASLLRLKASWQENIKYCLFSSVGQST